MKYLKLTIALLFLFATVVFAQSGSVRSDGLGGAAVASSDPGLIFLNPASIAECNFVSAGLSISRIFLLPETDRKFLYGILPLKSYGVAGITLSHYGYKYYSSTNFGLTTARKFGEKINAAVQLRYNRIQFGEGEINKASYIITPAILYTVNKNLKMSVALYVAANDENDYGETSAGSTAGIAYSFSDKTEVFFAVKQLSGYPLTAGSGIEYKPSEKLSFRAGFSTAPLKGTFGFGLNLKTIRLGIAATHHTVLGYTPSIALSWPAGY